MSGFIQIGQNVLVGTSDWRWASAARTASYPWRIKSALWRSTRKMRARRARCATPSATRFGNAANTRTPFCANFSIAPRILFLVGDDEVGRKVEDVVHAWIFGSADGWHTRWTLVREIAVVRSSHECSVTSQHSYAQCVTRNERNDPLRGPKKHVLSFKSSERFIQCRRLARVALAVHRRDADRHERRKSPTPRRCNPSCDSSYK